MGRNFMLDELRDERPGIAGVYLITENGQEIGLLYACRDDSSKGNIRDIEQRPETRAKERGEPVADASVHTVAGIRDEIDCLSTPAATPSEYFLDYDSAEEALDEVERICPSTPAAQIQTRGIDEEVGRVSDAETCGEDDRQKDEDRRKDQQLIPVSKLEEVAKLQEMLRRTDDALRSMDSLFSLKKVDKTLKELKFLEDSLYAEPERLSGLNAAFAAWYVRVGASYCNDLGFFEAAEKYVTDEMDGPASGIAALPVKKSLLRRSVPKIGETILTGGAATAAFFIGGSELVVFGAGLLGYGISKIISSIKRYRPKYSPGVNAANEMYSYAHTAEYDALAEAYAEHASLMREKLYCSSSELLSSLEDRVMKPKRGVKSDPEYQSGILDTIRNFTNTLKSISQATSAYDEAITARGMILENLDRHKKIEEYVRGLAR